MKKLKTGILTEEINGRIEVYAEGEMTKIKMTKWKIVFKKKRT